MLTQYKSHSLDRHVSKTWRMSVLLGNYVTPVPAQQRLGPQWYTGSADAIYQSLNLINDERPDLVVVVGADHVYRMDPQQIIDQHMAQGAGVTVAAIPVPRSDATEFGSSASAGTGTRWTPSWRSGSISSARPGHPDQALASMGNYVFTADVLVDALRKDAADLDSLDDMAAASSR